MYEGRDREILWTREVWMQSLQSSLRSDLGMLPQWVGEDGKNRGAFYFRRGRRLQDNLGFFFPTTSKFTQVLGQTQLPFPPFRELIIVHKVRPDHSSLQYKKWDLESPFMSQPAHRMLGGKGRLFLPLCWCFNRHYRCLCFTSDKLQFTILFPLWSRIPGIQDAHG